MNRELLHLTWDSPDNPWCGGGGAYRDYTILGMLELTKVKIATLVQRRPFGQVILKRIGPPAVSGRSPGSIGAGDDFDN